MNCCPRYEPELPNGVDQARPRFTVLGDDDFFTSVGAIDQLRELRLRLVDIDLAGHTFSLVYLVD